MILISWMMNRTFGHLSGSVFILRESLFSLYNIQIITTKRGHTHAHRYRYYKDVYSRDDDIYFFSFSPLFFYQSRGARTHRRRRDARRLQCCRLLAVAAQRPARLAAAAAAASLYSTPASHPHACPHVGGGGGNGGSSDSPARREREREFVRILHWCACVGGALRLLLLLDMGCLAWSGEREREE